MDDFKEVIPLSSDDEDDMGRPIKKGYLDEEMVYKMNFGGGDLVEKDAKKSRKEVFEEVIEKSKAYKLMQSEIKMAGEQLLHKLDDEF